MNDNLLILHAAKQADGALKFVDAKEFVNTKSAEEMMAKVKEYNEKAEA